MDSAPIKTWWSKDLAEHLGIGNSTLRKWSSELEKAGYIFLRDEHNRRAYVEHDAIALRVFQKYLENGMSYDSAAKAVTADYLRKDSSEIAISANSSEPPDQRYDERYEGVETKLDQLLESNAQQAEQIAQLIQMNRELYLRLDERDNAIRQLTEIVTAQKALAAASDDRQEEHAQQQEERERKRDEQLTTVLREINEIKKAANKSVWQRLFGK